MSDRFNEEAQALQQGGRWDELAALARARLAQMPLDLAGHTVFGIALQRLGRHAEARKYFERATGFRRDAERCYRMGDVSHDLGDLASALSWLEEAVALDPAHLAARYTLAVVLQDHGRQEAARDHYQAVLAHDPQHAKAHHNLGVALQILGDADGAIAAFRRTLELAPGHLHAAANLSTLLAEHGVAGEAKALLAPFLRPAEPSLLDLRAALILPAIPADRAEIDAARRTLLNELERLEERPPRLTDPLREIGKTPFFLAYQALPDRPVLEPLARIYRRACPELFWTAPHVAAVRPPRQRIRVGFASNFLHDHSVGRVIQGLVEKLPRDRFEVIAIFLGRFHDDAVARAIRDGADRHIVTAYDTLPAREAIAALELDLLCITDTGMEPLSYFVGCARLAPVQFSTWGHPVTSGLPTFDHYVSAAVWETADSPANYSERLYTLPGVASPAYYYRPEDPRGNSLLKRGGIALFCPQSVYKLHPDFDELAARILAGEPRARLYLVEARERRLTEALDARLRRRLGALAERVDWLPVMSRADYRACMEDADIVLDSVHFCGGNTSFEALALGKPVVTMPGAFMRGRFTAGLLTHMGLPQLIAADADAYVDQALRLASDAAWRREVGGLVGERAGCLFRDPRVIDEWSAFLVAAHERRLPRA